MIAEEARQSPDKKLYIPIDPENVTSPVEYASNISGEALHANKVHNKTIELIEPYL